MKTITLQLTKEDFDLLEETLQVRLRAVANVHRMETESGQTGEATEKRAAQLRALIAKISERGATKTTKGKEA